MNKLKQFSPIIFLKGFAMGIADIIPGVSGGTIAFITGIYHELLHNISQADHHFFKDLLSFKIKAAFERFNMIFLVSLAFGVASALVSMASLMHFLIGNYPIYTWSFFFGLILCSVSYLWRSMSTRLKMSDKLMLPIGVAVAYVIVSLVPVQTSNDAWIIFLSGTISITAMILPGISGSFILLILGKYEFITGALKNLLQIESLKTLVIFASGCALGLISFSKVLKWLLSHHYNKTMLLLIGFMVGSLKKIWPWRAVSESVVIRNKVHILREQNYFPDHWNWEITIAICIFLIGFFLVYAIERIAKKRQTV